MSNELSREIFVVRSREENDKFREKKRERKKERENVSRLIKLSDMGCALVYIAIATFYFVVSPPFPGASLS